MRLVDSTVVRVVISSTDISVDEIIDVEYICAHCDVVIQHSAGQLS